MLLTYITRLALRTAIAARLGDPDNVHWTQDELNYYINEALYTFGAVANYWKDYISFSSQSGEVYYNLNTIVTSPVGALAFNKTVKDILDGLNFHLIENITDITKDSEFLSLDDILILIKNKITEMQLVAGLILTKSEIPLASPPIKEVQLSDDIIDVIRVVYKVEDGTRKILCRDAENIYEMMDSADFSNILKGPDWFYTILSDTTQQMRIYPSSGVPATLEILTVNAQPDLVDSTSSILIPDNLFPYIKWGVLYEIFSKDGILNDPYRAAYCMTRWNEGLFIAKNYTSVLQIYINDFPVQIDSSNSIDMMDSDWMNLTSRTINMIGMAGYNMLIPNRVPDANEQGFSINSIINAPIPTSDLDNIQIKKEYLSVIINYCCHIAQVKDGISDIKRTNSYMEEFLTAGMVNNLRLANKGIGYATLLAHTKKQEIELNKIPIAASYQQQNQNQSQNGN